MARKAKTPRPVKAKPFGSTPKDKPGAATPPKVRMGFKPTKSKAKRSY